MSSEPKAVEFLKRLMRNEAKVELPTDYRTCTLSVMIADVDMRRRFYGLIRKRSPIISLRATTLHLDLVSFKTARSLKIVETRPGFLSTDKIEELSKNDVLYDNPNFDAIMDLFDLTVEGLETNLRITFKHPLDEPFV